MCEERAEEIGVLKREGLGGGERQGGGDAPRCLGRRRRLETVACRVPGSERDEMWAGVMRSGETYGVTEERDAVGYECG
jgi:hypothetical protein